MSKAQYTTYRTVFAEGLTAANRGNPFWTKADAMQAFAIFHKNAKVKNVK